jgi:hypothetical protein
MRRRARPFMQVMRADPPPRLFAAAADRLFLVPAVAAGAVAIAKNMAPDAGPEGEVLPATVLAACLAGFVSARWYRHRALNPLFDASDVAALSRRLSRVVYLGLYLLLGFNEVAALVCDRPMQVSAENLGCFLVTGVMILGLIRAQALVLNYVVRNERVLHQLLVPRQA